MRKITTLAIIGLFIACTGLLAANEERFRTYGVDGCKDWIILHNDEGRCLTFSRTCGEEAFHRDQCGWEDCSSIVMGGSPVDWTSSPTTVTSDYGIIYSVASGAGGYYIPKGAPASCGGYSEWVFVGDGSTTVTMPPDMVHLPGLQ